ncbi:YopX family protein [Bacillus sp. AFS019443]|uniref:YopX family protein n=1 Tax=Bacillus sp. AFS019443 TaxID=2034279 RepID=UPI000BF6553F|nr:YopX family protein [Bacillus sp. AFS019443]PEU16811.1 hypothetical protein CN524_03525 [Bacillus sp. AFS019443]
MREIKFRLYQKKAKKMMSWEQAKNLYKLDVLNDNEEDDFFSSWMQYTGLNDKNDKEIYEGDILDDPEEKPLYVEFSTKFAAFCFVDKFDPCGPTFYTTKDLHYEDLKVIGNIYENPELLEN